MTRPKAPDAAYDKAHKIKEGSPEDLALDKKRGIGVGGKDWIQKAIKHPGALHRELGVPEGKSIPASKLNKAAKSDNPTLARRANLAKTLKGMNK